MRERLDYGDRCASVPTLVEGVPEERPSSIGDLCDCTVKNSKVSTSWRHI